MQSLKWLQKKVERKKRNYDRKQWSWKKKYWHIHFDPTDIMITPVCWLQDREKGNTPKKEDILNFTCVGFTWIFNYVSMLEIKCYCCQWVCLCSREFCLCVYWFLELHSSMIGMKQHIMLSCDHPPTQGCVLHLAACIVVDRLKACHDRHIKTCDVKKPLHWHITCVIIRFIKHTPILQTNHSRIPVSMSIVL